MALKANNELNEAINKKVALTGLKDKPDENIILDEKSKHGRGRPVKGELWKPIQVRMPVKDIKALSDYCRQTGTTLSNKVRELVLQFMDKQGIR